MKRKTQLFLFFISLLLPFADLIAQTKIKVQETQILLDEGASWGYSCLTQIDQDTLGILYESSVAHMTFQAIRLCDFRVTK